MTDPTLDYFGIKVIVQAQMRTVTPTSAPVAVTFFEGKLGTALGTGSASNTINPLLSGLGPMQVEPVNIHQFFPSCLTIIGTYHCVAVVSVAAVVIYPITMFKPFI